ncbi:MAG: AAA family ATPase [Thermoanaerobaculia bacterium]
MEHSDSRQPSDNRIQRILILHPEAETRGHIDAALRAVSERQITVYEAESLTEGFDSVRRLDPHCILLDLSEQRELAFELAREARRPDRLIIGLYNPLLMRAHQDDFFRAAARAGVRDFIPVPVAAEELAAALAAGRRDAEQEAVAGEGRLISFISCKGGVGTTSLAVNVAVALATAEVFDNGVALCDAAVQFGNAASFLGVVPELDLADLVRHIDDVEALSTYLYRHPETGLRLLASPRDPREAERITPEDLSRVLIALRQRFGLVIVDCPAGIDLLTLAVLDLSESIQVVTEAITPTVLATASFLELLDEQGFGDRVQVILNRHSGAEGVLPGRMVNEELGRAVDHVLLDDKAVTAAASRGTPVVSSRPRAEFSKAVDRLAEGLVRGDLEPDSVAST